jgi:hypothetical protein
VDDTDVVESFRIDTLPDPITEGVLYTDVSMTQAYVAGADIAAVGEAATLYFKPVADFAGKVSFDYTASDGDVDSLAATAEITVQGVVVLNFDEFNLDNGQQTFLDSNAIPLASYGGFQWWNGSPPYTNVLDPEDNSGVVSGENVLLSTYHLSITKTDSSDFDLVGFYITGGDPDHSYDLVTLYGRITVRWSLRSC